MRNRSLCRSHRNHQLGSGPVGAPKGNLNALKTAAYAQPLTNDQLGDLAHRIVQDPGDLSPHLSPAIDALHKRAGRDPLKTLLLLQALLKQLIDPVATAIFSRLLKDYLDQAPPGSRARLQAQLWKHAMPLTPAQRVLLMRSIIAKLPPDKIRSEPRSAEIEKTTGKQSLEKQSTGSPREKKPPDPGEIPLNLILNRLLELK